MILLFFRTIYIESKRLFEEKDNLNNQELKKHYSTVLTSTMNKRQDYFKKRIASTIEIKRKKQDIIFTQGQNNVRGSGVNEQLENLNEKLQKMYESIAQIERTIQESKLQYAGLKKTERKG